MRYTTLALLWAGSVQSSLSKDRPGRITIYKRDDPGDFFAFPANQSSIVGTSTQPSSSPLQNLSVNATVHTDIDGQIPRYFVETNCNAAKKYKITQAWGEAQQLADAQTTFKLGYNYDAPHTQWLGKDWNSESSWIPWRYNYRLLIGDNFRRLAQMFGNHAQGGEYIYWYCHDYGRMCTEGVQAYSWDSLGWLWSNHYTVFCDAFYNRQAMSVIMAKYNSDPQEQKVMENFHLSRGQIMFHEIWHYKNLASSPRTGDYAYQAQPVWDLAKDKGTGWAYVNADSYALDAVAIYTQQYYKSSMSPVPWRELSKLDAAAASAVAEPPQDSAVAKTFDQTPSGWNGPLVTNDKPDLDIWQEIHLSDAISSSDPAQDAKPVCVGSPTKWTPRDPLNSVIPVFCADAVQQGVQDQDSGSIARHYLSDQDVVNLSIDWPSGNPWKPTQDDCVKSLSSIMNGCDTDSGKNPMNWKHGGFLTSSVAKYNIVPQVDRKYTPGTCSFHLHEEEYFQGIDGPGTERQHEFYLRDSIKDGDGTVVSSVPNDLRFGDGGGNPYVCNSFYAPLQMTPEAQNGDYIQFTIGSLSWTTKNSTGLGRCNTGGWDSQWAPVGRDMDCYFAC